MDIELWYGVFGPASVPRDIVQKWNQELASILALADVKENLLKQGLIAAHGPPEALAALLKAEVTRWKEVVQKAGIKAD